MTAGGNCHRARNAAERRDPVRLGPETLPAELQKISE